jgi:8-oxo-dGTP pyrophosphatase MutT (NUDIX family)
MADLLKYKARICPVAIGMLINNNKVLLVKHKKLGIWLAPGGHIEEGELPHQAAEREVFEETGVKVMAVSPLPLINAADTQALPVPILSGIHWVSKENYKHRLSSKSPEKPFETKLWKRGCEQHFGMVFLVKPVGKTMHKMDANESTDIGWFGQNDIKNLETEENIKAELKFAFELEAAS